MMGGIIGAPKPEIIYASANHNSSNPIGTVSHADQAIGASHPKRRVLLLIGGHVSGITPGAGVTSVAVGGAALSRIFITPDANAIYHQEAWISDEEGAGGPAGATGTIAVTRSGNWSQLMWVAFATYRIKSTTPFDDMVGATANPAGGTIDLPARGVLAAYAERISGTGFAWTGASEVVDQRGATGNAIQYSGALVNETTAETGRSISTSSDGSHSNFAISLR